MADLVRAYPELLAGFDGVNLIWRDGTRMPVGPALPGRSAEEVLRHGSIIDQLATRYPAGAPLPPPQDDPGRVRNQAFFDKMYGDCRAGQVAPRLVRIVWLPKTWGHAVSVTPVNGIDRRLEAVSRELDELPGAGQAIPLSNRRHLQLPLHRRHGPDEHAFMGRRDRPQHRVLGLLAVAAIW